MVPSHTPPKRQDIAWLAWEKQKRSTTLARELGAEPFQLESRLPRFFRYINLSVQTLLILLRGKYRTVFAQNPSIVLCLLVALTKRFGANRKIIIDSHTPYVKLGGVARKMFDLATGLIYRNADLVIVTNEHLRQTYLNKYGETDFYVLPDRIPEMNGSGKMALAGKVNILLISTYAADEPYIEAFKAMSNFKDYTLYVTGKKKKVSEEALRIKPENVILTDFLSDAEYDAFLNSVDIVMDLTDIEDCMLCGAYEAVAAEKVLITSDKKVLREYFDEGVVHTRNDADGISASIRHAVRNHGQLSRDIVRLKHKRFAEWKGQWAGLLREAGIGDAQGNEK